MRNTIFYIKSRDVCPCPECQSALRHRDYRLRIMKMEGGEKKWVRIERLKCTNPSCRRLHNALPDCLVPGKHYATEIISGVLDGIVSPDDREDEDYPCEATMHRWKHWMMANQLRIEGYLRSAGIRYLGLSQDVLGARASLLDQIRSASGSWLESVLRTIYNSGGFLVPS